MKLYNKSGLIVAAPASGSGKTLVSLALLRALKNIGCDVSGAKVGPDYIDPQFHRVAIGRDSVNLDAWAMAPERLRALAQFQEGDHLLVEGVMGLFDAAADKTGSTADVAKILGLPVILVVDAAKQSHSVAALVRGFRDHDPDLVLSGVILNRVGSVRHETLLRDALSSIGVSIFGCLPRDKRLELPERHLGLVQASEIGYVEEFVQTAAGILEQFCEMKSIKEAFQNLKFEKPKASTLPVLGQRIAVAQDEAFSFMYPHLLNDWKSQGADVSHFSPLKNEAPNEEADAIYLPGGYPELFGDKIAAADQFRAGMNKAFDQGKLIYGECGGYMVLGEGLIDGKGHRHEMLGLLKLETSFKERKRHLGYRRIRAIDFPLGQALNGHEFHYSSEVKASGSKLFKVSDAAGNELGSAGLRNGNVMGSYIHLIDRAD